MQERAPPPDPEDGSWHPSPLVRPELAPEPAGWMPLLEPGLALLSGRSVELPAFHQELAHYALHSTSGHVLWCDGSHAFNPYDFAELNLVRGRSAEEGAERMLVKRCMTPFQWDSVLTQHLDQKLAEVEECAFVLAAPYDRLFSTDELADWEQEDYVRFSLQHLAGLAERFRVPLLISVDLSRWWRTHPALAKLTYEGTSRRWAVSAATGRWIVTEEGGRRLDPTRRHTVTLEDFFVEEAPAVVVPVRRPQQPFKY